MLQGGGREECTDEQGPFAASDNPAAHHVQPVESRQLYVSALGSALDDHAHSTLRAARRRHDNRRAHPVVSQTVVEISLVGDLGLCHNH